MFGDYPGIRLYHYYYYYCYYYYYYEDDCYHQLPVAASSIATFTPYTAVAPTPCPSSMFPRAEAMEPDRSRRRVCVYPMSELVFFALKSVWFDSVGSIPSILNLEYPMKPYKTQPRRCDMPGAQQRRRWTHVPSDPRVYST